MVEKPPSKTESSHAKGVAEGSWSVKRNHSDSSTPSQETATPKSQVHPGTY